MIDFYKTSLELLQQIMKEEKYDNWVEWLQKDIRLWENERSTEHHLRAYGGMGSFNDVVVGGTDLKGTWKSQVFTAIQSLACGLAKNGEIPDFYSSSADIMNGWRCQNCSLSRINERNIEIFLIGKMIPKLMKQFIEQNQLHEALNIDKILDLEEVKARRGHLKAMIINAKITIPEDINWLWTCPNCGSNKAIVYRWIVNENGDLEPSNDNLEINQL
jgi:hypothetical protein